MAPSWILVPLLVVALVGCTAVEVPRFDPAFGTAGTVITDLGGSSVVALVLQPDRKIVAVGSKYESGGYPDLALVRYRPDGSLDPTFGSEGIAITEVGDGILPHDAVIQADGKILALGSMNQDKTAWDLALLRYNPDGSLDTGFGRGGRVITGVEGHENAKSIALLPDGKILVAGSISNRNGYPPNKALLLRYNPDGSLDPAFGHGGIVTNTLRWSNGARAMALQADGKIVVTGNLMDTTNRDDFGLLRYNPHGTLDTAFGHEGVVVSDFGDTDDAEAVLVQPNGQILVAGFSWTPVQSHPYATFALVRYNPDGALDLDFGSRGIAIHDLGFPGKALAVALQADGKIVLFGEGYFPYPKFVTIRCNADGSLDPTFPGNGEPVAAPGGDSWPGALAIQPDGKIVVAGGGQPRPPTLGPGDIVPSRAGSVDFMLVRYLP